MKFKRAYHLQQKEEQKTKKKINIIYGTSDQYHNNDHHSTTSVNFQERTGGLLMEGGKWIRNKRSEKMDMKSSQQMLIFSRSDSQLMEIHVTT